MHSFHTGFFKCNFHQNDKNTENLNSPMSVAMGTALKIEKGVNKNVSRLQRDNNNKNTPEERQRIFHGN